MRSHLGALLQAGDLVQGYDLTSSLLDLDLDLAAGDLALPEVVLVRRAARQGKEVVRVKGGDEEEEVEGSLLTGGSERGRGKGRGRGRGKKRAV